MYWASDFKITALLPEVPPSYVSVAVLTVGKLPSLFASNASGGSSYVTYAEELLMRTLGSDKLGLASSDPNKNDGKKKESEKKNN